jgi:DNA-directed RNA polymerase specialized sigma24 family protein
MSAKLTRGPEETNSPITESILLAILSLLVEEREARQPERSRAKIEVLLANAGLDASTIGRVLDKQQGAVRKAISRARARITTSEVPTNSIDSGAN